MELGVKDLQKKIQENEINTSEELQEYCKLIYKEMKKLSVEFEKNTISDKELLEYFKKDDSNYKFFSITLAQKAIRLIGIRNNFREIGKLGGEKEQIPYSKKQTEMINKYYKLQQTLDYARAYEEQNLWEEEEEMELE